ncbi:DUF2946 domain-containing protein [Burkholderia sp. BCC1972]|uniref:DUF2946 domain-containing protein n=1 Tax=Burkholderia sp. BCC1972 TaxID=2817438 RepID=UPI002ABE2889|nr:DUF2946 domain-containing protein [Burkholderia sp. BCC1972]
MGSILGLLAILMATLAPTVSQSLSSERQFDAVSGALCTARNGADIATPDHSPLPENAAHWQACAYCGLLADIPALLGGATGFVPIDSAVYRASATPFQTLHGTFHFAAAQPRAPPFSS